jgi:hypothetical protein
MRIFLADRAGDEALAADSVSCSGRFFSLVTAVR